MAIEQEMRIKELEEQVEQLTFIHGICDKFGTYQSLCKDAEIIMFFLESKEQTRRYIEVVNYFKPRMWSTSTIERHLRILKKNMVLVKGDLPGEYRLDRDMSEDVDSMLHYVIGDSLYRLAKKYWGENDYGY